MSARPAVEWSSNEARGAAALAAVRETPLPYRPRPPLLDVAREQLRARRLSRRTEKAYVVGGRLRYPTVQDLLGHKDLATTMIYTHVLNRGPAGVRSPLDGVLD